MVAHNSAAELGRTLPALAAQLAPGDELIVADNDSSDASAATVTELVPGAQVVATGANIGFPAGVNAAESRASGDVLVILNPDAEPLPGFRDAIVAPLLERRGWAAWMGLVTTKAGSQVNSEGNPLHFTGITWAGGHGTPVAEEAGPREVTIASGACLAVSRDAFERLGGMADRFFLYHEDVDLSMRLHLAGERVGIEPAAAVDHDYEFIRGFQKWRFMERNRWLFLLRTYPASLLALIPVSVAGGWGREKLLANLDVVRRLPWALRSRGAVQRSRAIGTAEFARLLTPDLDSPFFGRAGQSAPLRWALRAYWRVVLALLR